MANAIPTNGTLKKRLVQGGVGISLAAVISFIGPMILGHGDKIAVLEVKHEKLYTEFEPIKKLPDKVQKLNDDIKNLRTLFILVNKDNADLKNYLELNK